jgi:hypothetical protein
MNKVLNKKLKLKVGNQETRKKQSCCQEIGKISQIPKNQGIRAEFRSRRTVCRVLRLDQATSFRKQRSAPTVNAKEYVEARAHDRNQVQSLKTGNWKERLHLHAKNISFPEIGVVSYRK